MGNRKRIFLVLSVALLTLVCFTAMQEDIFSAAEDIFVDVYDPARAFDGTTLLPDNHLRGKPRVIEVDMKGNIVWEYILPPGLRRYTNPGFDVEALPNNNVLLTLPGKGVYEVSRNGDEVWSYLDPKVSHDADRLPNGNTLVVYGNDDKIDDAQVKEVSPQGRIVWAWHAKDHFNRQPYKDIFRQGWTHTNAAVRLSNGNTLISLRNFNIVVEVDPQGKVLRTIGEGVYQHQHDPEMLFGGNILVANHARPQSAEEMDPETGRIVWQFKLPDPEVWPVRDADRLPNGNTLITAATEIIEVTADGDIVWQLSSGDVTFRDKEAAGLGFYKAQRIAAH
ncbi:aryl-sulfate sulfotransferase [Candidatus Omnitrophota bacterium]